MIIDCDTCVMRDLACSDCVVSVLINISDSAPSASITSEEISPTGLSAISLLSEKGLVPPLRFHA